MAIIIQGINSPVGTDSSEIIGTALKKAGIKKPFRRVFTRYPLMHASRTISRLSLLSGRSLKAERKRKRYAP